MSKVLGLDLGTTNSCIAYINKDGKAEVIKSLKNSRLTPSVVFIDSEGKYYVGEDAKKKKTRSDKNYFYETKRFIGRDFESLSEKDKSFVGYTIVRDENRIRFKTQEGKLVSPEQIASEIIKFMVESARKYLDDDSIKDLVITVPANFENTHKEAVLDAVKIASSSFKKNGKTELNLIRTIEEPTAAALAYTNQLESGKDNNYILVYDFGGGTFDTIIYDITKESDGNVLCETVDKGGDPYLGGKDIDQVILDYFIEEFEKQNDLEEVKNDPTAINKLKELAEDTKIEMSNGKSEHEVFDDVKFKNEYYSLEILITKEKFRELALPVIKKTLEVVGDLLEKNSVEKSDIEAVLLVGGSSKSELVRE